MVSLGLDPQVKGGRSEVVMHLIVRIMDYMLRECKQCRKEFNTRPYNVKRGFGNYCSRLCSDKGRNQGKDIECDNCGKIKFFPTNRWKRGVTGMHF